MSYQVLRPRLQPPRGYASIQPISSAERYEAAQGTSGVASIPQAPQMERMNTRMNSQGPSGMVGSMPSYPTQQQQQQQHCMTLADRNASTIGQVLISGQDVAPEHSYVSRNLDKPLQKAIDALPALPIRPNSSRDIFLDAEEAQWKPSRRFIEAPKPVSHPLPGDQLGHRRVGPFPIDNSRAGAPSEVLYKEDRGLAIVPPPITQEEQVRGIHVVERPNRNPLFEGDVERPHGPKRIDAYNAESDPGNEWKYAPECRNISKRRIIPPHLNGDDIIGVNVPAGTFTGKENEFGRSLRPASTINEKEGNVFKSMESHDDVISYSYAGAINPNPSQTIQRNPDKPTTCGGYVPPEAQMRPSTSFSRRERKPAPWMRSSIDIGSDATRLIASYASPANASTSASSLPPTSEAVQSNRLYELNRRRYTRDSGPFF